MRIFHDKIDEFAGIFMVFAENTAGYYIPIYCYGKYNFTFRNIYDMVEFMDNTIDQAMLVSGIMASGIGAFIGVTLITLCEEK